MKVALRHRTITCLPAPNPPKPPTTESRGTTTPTSNLTPLSSSPLCLSPIKALFLLTASPQPHLRGCWNGLERTLPPYPMLTYPWLSFTSVSGSGWASLIQTSQIQIALKSENSEPGLKVTPHNHRLSHSDRDNLVSQWFDVKKNLVSQTKLP